jgi:hypothetical protein
VILRRLIPDALELVATNADHWHPDFVMKLWITFHPPLAPAPTAGSRCLSLAGRDVDTVPTSPARYGDSSRSPSASRRTIGVLWSGKIRETAADCRRGHSLNEPVADGGLALGQAIKITDCPDYALAPPGNPSANMGGYRAKRRRRIEQASSRRRVRRKRLLPIGRPCDRRQWQLLSSRLLSRRGDIG